MLIQTFEKQYNGIDLYRLESDKKPQVLTREDYNRKDYYFYPVNNPQKLYTGIIDIYENTLPENFIEVGVPEDPELTEEEMATMLKEVF
jgi:hypothetical protein